MTSIVIGEQGGMRFIWQDDLAPMLALGKPNVERVSRVEPDEKGRWWAILEPVGGPTLGPFTLRGDAIAAEIEWLEKNVMETA
ncbi:MAG: hypothetical protein IT428_16185 [Planctomycetaceae bacterium]|nr:hypothetical protein [Planctomycetaceae bacterium]